jgi:hypothetical protein
MDDLEITNLNNFKKSYRKNYTELLKEFFNEKKEIWAFHPDSDMYVFSNQGRVKNLSTGNILKTTANKNGYLALSIKTLKKGKKYIILHRCVLEAFVPFLGNDVDYFEANHIDGNKKNNHLSNLNWLSRKENLLHSKYNGLNKRKKLSDNDIKEILKEVTEKNYKEVAKKFNISRQYCKQLIKGEVARTINGGTNV